MIVISLATLIGLYRTNQFEWAPIPAANLVMFILVFGKTALAGTEFYDESIRVRTLVGSSSIRLYADITGIDCYDNGVIIRFETERRIKILLADDAREFLRFLTEHTCDVEIVRKQRMLFNTWQSNFARRPSIWGD